MEKMDLSSFAASAKNLLPTEKVDTTEKATVHGEPLQAVKLKDTTKKIKMSLTIAFSHNEYDALIDICKLESRSNSKRVTPTSLARSLILKRLKKGSKDDQ